jgi:hypothetical protein
LVTGGGCHDYRFQKRCAASLQFYGPYSLPTSCFTSYRTRLTLRPNQAEKASREATQDHALDLNHSAVSMTEFYDVVAHKWPLSIAVFHCHLVSNTLAHTPQLHERKTTIPISNTDKSEQ